MFFLFFHNCFQCFEFILKGVVECMAAGTVMIAHDSAGPQQDIIVPYCGQKTGFLAESEQDYCDCLLTIYKMTAKKRNMIREAAKKHINKFSQEEFNLTFMETFKDLCLNKYLFNNKNKMN
jgi:alpha-1,2-mannosyltransferase